MDGLATTDDEPFPRLQVTVMPLQLIHATLSVAVFAVLAVVGEILIRGR